MLLTMQSFDAINNQLNTHPDRAVIIAGDFDHLDLKAVMQKNVNFPTRDKNILDQVYTSVPGPYKADPSLDLSLSAYISLEITPS